VLSSYTQSFLDASAYRNVSFPKIRHIHLDCIDFDEVSVNMPMDCLMERDERNAEVQLLCLDDCYNVSGYDIERLEEIVVDVICNAS